MHAKKKKKDSQTDESLLKMPLLVHSHLILMLLKQVSYETNIKFSSGSMADQGIVYFGKFGRRCMFAESEPVHLIVP